MNLVRRSIVAAVAVPLVLFVVWLGSPPLAVLVSIACVACWLELRELLAAIGSNANRLIGAVAVAFCPLALWMAGGIGVLIVAVASLAALGVWMVAQRASGGLAAAAGNVLGFIYIGLTLSSTVAMRALSNGVWYLAYSLILVWVADTAAYTFGRLFGRHPLARTVSPNKTVEGAAGSMATALLVAFMLPDRGVLAGDLKLAFGLVVWGAALLGDLSESWLKRRAGVKDSGTLLPGHGGFLDRLDSLILAAPSAYICVAVWSVR